MLNTVTTEYMMQLIKNIPIFTSLNEKVHKQIIDNIKLEYFGKDYILFNQNDEATKMYIIKNGKVRVSFPDQPEKDSVFLTDKQFFGEMALVSELPRNATVTLEEDSEIFTLAKNDFKQLIGSDPNAAAMVSKIVIDRMKDNERG